MKFNWHSSPPRTDMDTMVHCVSVLVRNVCSRGRLVVFNIACAYWYCLLLILQDGMEEV